VTDNTAAIVNPVSYSGYGTPDAAVGSPFAFTGEMCDSSGLQYHRARYYSPSLGMWISEDPLETPNRYGYVGGNVVNAVDRSGLFRWEGDGGIVDANDCLSCIAEEGGVIQPGARLPNGSPSFVGPFYRAFISEVMSLNGITNPDLIYQGSRLMDFRVRGDRYIIGE
jgi:RHS repeat-associated protein